MWQPNVTTIFNDLQASIYSTSICLLRNLYIHMIHESFATYTDVTRGRHGTPTLDVTNPSENWF